MTKPFFCICLLQLGYLLKSMYISLLLIMSVSVTLDTVDINQILECLCPRTDVVKVVPEEIYIAMIDSLR